MMNPYQTPECSDHEKSGGIQVIRGSSWTGFLGRYVVILALLWVMLDWVTTRDWLDLDPGARSGMWFGVFLFQSFQPWLLRFVAIRKTKRLDREQGKLDGAAVRTVGFTWTNQGKRFFPRWKESMLALTDRALIVCPEIWQESPENQVIPLQRIVSVRWRPGIGSGKITVLLEDGNQMSFLVASGLRWSEAIREKLGRS